MLSNVLACISCCYLLNMNILDIIDSLKAYKSASRRYNLTFINDNVIVDDYGHHPDEIKATISSIKQVTIKVKLGNFLVEVSLTQHTMNVIMQ